MGNLWAGSQRKLVAQSRHSFIFLSCLQPPSLNALQLCDVRKSPETFFLLFSWCVGALLAEAMRQCLPKDWAYFSCDTLPTCTRCAGWLNWGAATLETCLDRIGSALGRFLWKSLSLYVTFFLIKRPQKFPMVLNGTGIGCCCTGENDTGKLPAPQEHGLL